MLAYTQREEHQHTCCHVDLTRCRQERTKAVPSIWFSSHSSVAVRWQQRCKCQVENEPVQTFRRVREQ
jgi:hypothetical protein